MKKQPIALTRSASRPPRRKRGARRPLFAAGDPRAGGDAAEDDPRCTASP